METLISAKMLVFNGIMKLETLFSILHGKQQFHAPQVHVFFCL